MSSSLHYHISFKYDSIFVRIEEVGSRRVLYYDTLIRLAALEDRDLIAFLKKIHTRFSRVFDTLSFQMIEVDLADAAELFRLLAKTKRVFYQSKPLECDWTFKGKIFWKGEGELFSAFLKHKQDEIPLEACEKVFPSWCIAKGSAFPIEPSLSWRWIEMFLKGPISLDGVKKKRFLEEEPPIIWIEEKNSPQLFLIDMTGCFANLAKESSSLEKDLLEVGFIRKMMDNSNYFCPSDQLFSALELLLDVGWEIFDWKKRRLFKQTSTGWTLTEENNAICVTGEALFQEKKVSLRNAMEANQRGKLFVEIDQTSVGLLDRRKGEILEGQWSGESLYIKREHAAQ